MSRSASKLVQNDGASRERLLDLYTIQENGNSRSVTVPAETGLELKTLLCMRLGRCNGRVIYLKAIEQHSSTPQHPEVAGRTGDGGEAVREKGHEFRQVRGNETEKMVTIPADYDDDGAFALESQVAMLAGYTADGVRYLRIVPEDVLNERLQRR
ncbi:MAG TPA: hypothetical protein VFJ06_08770 [Halococcus sp.]|nr:hypothetical protein [Halococcus sp.]